MNVLMKKYNNMQEEGIIGLKSEYYNKLNYDSYRRTGQYMFNLKKQKIILIRGEEDIEYENKMKRKILDDEQELAKRIFLYFFYLFQFNQKIKLSKKKQVLLYKFRAKECRKQKKKFNSNLMLKSSLKIFIFKNNSLL